MRKVVTEMIHKPSPLLRYPIKRSEKRDACRSPRYLNSKETHTKAQPSCSQVRFQNSHPYPSIEIRSIVPVLNQEPLHGHSSHVHFSCLCVGKPVETSYSHRTYKRKKWHEDVSCGSVVGHPRVEKTSYSISQRCR
jgi:hypothetical protein